MIHNNLKIILSLILFFLSCHIPKEDTYYQAICYVNDKEIYNAKISNLSGNNKYGWDWIEINSNKYIKSNFNCLFIRDDEK
jgi:hypothetical protein